MKSEVQATESLLEEFSQTVKDRGLRMTNQRMIIATAFFNSPKHLTVDDLYAMVRKIDKAIGYATVYRTLRLLEEAGLAKSHQFDNRKVCYEVERSHHDHIICMDCGHIEEFENEVIENVQKEVALEHGFMIRSHRMEIYGSCLTQDCPNRN